MKDKLMLIPEKEEMQGSPMMEFYAKFNIGFIPLEIQMIQSKMINLNKRAKINARKRAPVMLKKYLLIMNISNFGWCFDGYDDYDKCKMVFRDIMNKLKYGYDVEFVDLGKQQQPIRVSYRGVEVLW